jgi:predicted dehydrogenase
MAMRFGLLGTGHWAAETHAAALATHPEVDFVGVWGRTPTAVVTLAQRYGVAAFADVGDLLDEVDAVAIAVPPDVQSELAQRAAAAGRHLLLDKPLALATDAADRVVAEVERHHVASVVFFTRRFHVGIESFLAEAVATGGWDGATSTAYAQIFEEGNPYRASTWRRQRGGLWDVGPHALSIVLPVLGPVAEVQAMDGPRASTHVLARHVGGAVSSLALTLDAAPASSRHETEFYGNAGRVLVPSPTGTKVEAFGSAVSDLVALAASPGNRTHRCDVRFGREVVAVLEAADRARASGAAVQVRG